ncbi:MAG: sulfatase-like hydrolase/transferase [Eubacteriales bacterium]|nr:sulfatase-like hydrolase/transferase [Eubacteriales bacterium]
MSADHKKKKHERIKKSILIAVLLCVAVLTGTRWEQFYVEKTYSVENTDNKESGEEYEPDEISVLGNQTVVQEFEALESEILNVAIDFKVWEQKNGKGKIVVEIQTMDGEVLASAEKAVKKLQQNKKGITTAFSVPAKLQKGETYRVVINSRNVENEKGCYLYAVEEKGNLFGNLTVNGEAVQGRIKLKMSMMHFAWNSMVFIFLVLMFAIFLLLIPVERVQNWIDRKCRHSVDINVLCSRILFFVSPAVAFFVVQRYSDYGLKAFLKLMFHPKGILNIFLYGLVWWVIYLICNRTKYTAVILVGVSSVMGLANYYVWRFRGSPVMAADIASLGTAMDVAGGYDYSLNLSALWAIAVTAVFIALALGLRSYKGLGWKKRGCMALAFLVPYGVFYTQLLHGTLLKDHGVTVSVWEPSRNYAKNGSLLSFFLSYTYYRVEKPDNYSVAKAEEITEKYVSDSAKWEEEEIRPNMIAIMNEAFSDLNADGNLETSEDYMPYIHGLKEDTVKGDLYVSVFAGNTANSEYEFLTGCSMAFMPFRAIPYNTYIKDRMPSLTWSLKEAGYAGNYAVHPFSKTAWNRNVVYPYLGFEEFYGASDMENVEYIRNFASDKTDFDFIISKYEETRAKSDEPFYTFSVTVQNHGGYTVSQGLVDKNITITDPARQDEEAEQYINLVKESDHAFKELTEYFEQIDEPTVIVMFGDHQPSLSTGFYEKLFRKSSDSFSLQDTVNKYTVPYVIWANYDIEEEEADMSANYLSAYLMKVIGGKMTGYQKYLMDLYEKIPMITANGYRGDDGELHELDEESEYSELLNEYKILQYNNMFDTLNRIEEFYSLSGAG